MHHIAGLSIFFRSIYCNFISVVKTYKSSMFVDYIEMLVLTPFVIILCLLKFSVRHTLKIGTIADLIEYRRLRDKPKKLEELSQKYKISRERVRQIEEKALEKLTKEVSNTI